jgi:hypothetical protein
MDDNSMRGNLAPGKREKYALAGKATLTVCNPATEKHFTYLIKLAKKQNKNDADLFFVGILSGPDNWSDYSYLGIVRDGVFRSTRKSHISESAASFRAFQWLTTHWEDERVQVYHEGVCGMCGRKLTVPESIESGIGPICAAKGGF